jgi:putative holliday junction resolvase
MKKSNLLALDIGNERVGIALARADVRVPVPVSTLARSDPAFWDQLAELVSHYDVSQIVLGLPRGLNGQETGQTVATRAFGNELVTRLALPIQWQDEALTSVKAETVLRKTGKPYSKGDIDALAACYILSDYMEAKKVTA